MEKLGVRKNSSIDNLGLLKLFKHIVKLYTEHVVGMRVFKVGDSGMVLD